MARVRTVLGEIDSADLGVTLFHEHLFVDGTGAWRRPAPGDEEARRVAEAPVSIEDLGRLRNDPYLSLDNTRLDNRDVAVAEATWFAKAGGRTIIDQSSASMGRDPDGLRQVAERTGLQIVMGCGFYLQRTHPAGLASMSPDDIADLIELELRDGVGGIRPGIIGEIGVGPDFTPGEERVLRGAARAQRRARVPLSVHLPGWLRHGHRVLDVVEEEGGDLRATVLCHMNPSMADRDYQCSLADRGARLGYDMVGMELCYPGEGQSPSDDDNARAVAALIRDGYAGSLLLSGDVFLKVLLRRYGGFGYDHLITNFLPRLEALGVERTVARGLITDNPRAVFETAAEGART
jgi:phosphotriesterase-related protein